MFKIFCHRSSSLYSFPDSLRLMLKLLTLIKSNELNSFPKKTRYGNAIRVSLYKTIKEHVTTYTLLLSNSLHFGRALSQTYFA